MKTDQRQHLIVDADDTLWENNIYFERAFENFCDFLDHSSMSPADVREVLDEIEIVNSKVHGYGTANFARNLTECYHKLVERDVREEDLFRIMSFTEQILHHPIELIAGVEETLEYLAVRHDLTLFTKGNAEETTCHAEEHPEEFHVDGRDEGCDHEQDASNKPENGTECHGFSLVRYVRR